VAFFFLGQQPPHWPVRLTVYSTALALTIMAELTFEYVTYKAVWGDRDVFEGEMSMICCVQTCVSRWRWKFLVFAPNYIAVASSSFAAGVMYRAYNFTPIDATALWVALVLLLMWSALFHFFLVLYWTSKVKAAPITSSEKEVAHGRLAEACDAGNVQFLGTCFRKDASDSEQGSRLATTILVKTPMITLKGAAVAVLWCSGGENGEISESDEFPNAAHSLALALLLNAYGVLQLLSTFLGMFCKRPLCYCVPLAMLLCICLPVVLLFSAEAAVVRFGSARTHLRTCGIPYVISLLP